MSLTQKTDVYIKTKIYCPLYKKEQGIKKCFTCKYYKGVGTNKESTHLKVNCNYG